MRLGSFLSEELWFFLLLAILLGILIPGIGLYITPYAIYPLLIVMFLTSLRIDLKQLYENLSNRNLLILSLLLIFVISPILALPFSFLLRKDLAIGLILYAATPAAMANSFYMTRLRKNAAFAVLITTTSTLLSPIATPILVKLLTGVFVNVDTFSLFQTLIKYILLPLFLAEIVRRYAKSATKKLLRISKPIGNLCMFFVVFGVISASAGRLGDFVYPILILAVYITLSFLIGLALPTKERFVIGFSNGIRNGTLAMVVALNVFGPDVAMVGVIATLLHNILIVPIMMLHRS